VSVSYSRSAFSQDDAVRKVLVAIGLPLHLLLSPVQRRLPNNKQGTKLDVVLNNAGIYGPGRQSLDTVDKDLLLEVFTTNAVGPLLVVQQLRKSGLLNRPALVANVTSKVGWSRWWWWLCGGRGRGDAVACGCSV